MNFLIVEPCFSSMIFSRTSEARANGALPKIKEARKGSDLCTARGVTSSRDPLVPRLWSPSCAG